MNTTTSSAQQYLSQVRQIDEQMRIIQSQISNIVELSGLSYDKVQIAPNGDSKVEKLAMRRLELLDKYEKKRDELIRSRYEVTDMILTLKGQYQHPNNLFLQSENQFQRKWLPLFQKLFRQLQRCEIIPHLLLRF